MEKRRKRCVWPQSANLVVRGRVFTQKELVMVRRLIRTRPGWGRTRLSYAICDLLQWNQSNGRPKDRACRVALLRLESLGFVRLPKKKLERGGRPPIKQSPAVTVELPPVNTMPEVIECRRVQTRAESRFWNALVATYHYLGLATPVGRFVRYLLFGDGMALGAISFTDCAWSVSPRDLILLSIGLKRGEIRDLVITNNRFLILPDVKVPNLASRLLAASLRQVGQDWAAVYGTVPLVAETFVDPQRFAGTCYRAANWLLVGSTKGFSKQGNRHRGDNAPKLVFLRGMHASVCHKLRAAAVSGSAKHAA